MSIKISLTAYVCSSRASIRVPTHDPFIVPILRFLEIKPEGAPTRDAQEAAAQDEPPPVVPATTSAAAASKDDRLEQALQELREANAADLLDKLLQVSPNRFAKKPNAACYTKNLLFNVRNNPKKVLEKSLHQARRMQMLLVGMRPVMSRK